MNRKMRRTVDKNVKMLEQEFLHFIDKKLLKLKEDEQNVNQKNHAILGVDDHDSADFRSHKNRHSSIYQKMLNWD